MEEQCLESLVLNIFSLFFVLHFKHANVLNQNLLIFALYAVYYPDIVRDGVDRAQFDAYLLARAARYSQAWPNSTTTRDISEAFKFYYADWPYYDDPIRNRDKLGDVSFDSFCL